MIAEVEDAETGIERLARDLLGDAFGEAAFVEVEVGFALDVLDAGVAAELFELVIEELDRFVEVERVGGELI